MTRLVRLYPRLWRDRYEAELLALLEDRPPSPLDRIDLVRGALDAHLNPATDAVPMPWTYRLPGLAALATGALWVVAFVVGSFDNGTATGSLVAFALLLMFISLPGDYLAAHARRTAIGIGALTLAIVLFNLSPWPMAFFIYVAAAIVFLSGTLSLAAIRADIGSTARWRLVWGAVVLPALVLLLVLTTGLVPQHTATSFVLLGVPYGLAWALIGVRMTVRGSQTLVDPLPAVDSRRSVELEMPA